MEQIIITIATTGEAKVEVRGVKGRSCQDTTREFEQALGQKVEDTPTREAYEQVETVQQRNLS